MVQGNPHNATVAHTDTKQPAKASRQVKSGRTGITFIVVLLTLFSAGWAANHFSTMVAVMREQEFFSALVLNAAYGIYAAGMVPCLLLGGILADRFGARPTVLVGAVAAAAGNLLLMFWQNAEVLFSARLLIGVGVGLTISAGTAWAGKLRSASGVVLAGIALSAGFALGPIASGFLAFLVTNDAAVWVPFIATVALSAGAAVATGLVRETAALIPPPAAKAPSSGNVRAQHSMGRALATAIPMALWVFSCAAITMVTLTEYIGSQFLTGVLFPGFAAFLAFSAALIVQTFGRKFGWGPKAGVIGAMIATLGYLLAAAGSDTPPMWLFIITALFLGTAYGMCLREGLLDVDTYAPPARRGTTIGIYYVFTYMGFALPVVLEWVRPAAGVAVPMVMLACLALVSAVIRVVQIRSGYLDRKATGAVGPR